MPKPPAQPFQTELAAIMADTTRALEENHALNAVIEKSSYVGMPERVMRTARLSSFMIMAVFAGEDREVTVVEVRSRQSPNDESDPETMSVDIYEVIAGAEHNTGYSIWHERAKFAEASGQSYTITKNLPELPDNEDGVAVDELDDDAAELEDFLASEMSSVTPEDIALLGKIATTMQS